VARWTARSLSIVVPVFDEAENARRLVERIVAAVRPIGRPFEVVIVDDGSRDRTLDVLRELRSEVPELVVVALRRNFGQTLALQAGLDRARGDAIVTLDGDLQNDPADIPRLLAELEDGADVVSGWRKQRQDTLVLRKVPSWIANRMVRRVTGVTIHDQGCSLKAYRSDVVRALDLYGDLHRFIAVLTLPLGVDIREIEVQHHPRTAGISKYGLSRVLKVLADLFTLQMLTRFRESPLRWFGLLATPFGIAAVTALAWARFDDDPSLVLMAVGSILGVTSTACLMCGILGDLVIATSDHARRRRVVISEWTAP
jgi:glycosyltransferase involved in cell wall biosynthesis